MEIGVKWMENHGFCRCFRPLRQDLSNFLWSAAVLQMQVPMPLETIAMRAAELHWQQFRPQETRSKLDFKCF